MPISDIHISIQFLFVRRGSQSNKRWNIYLSIPLWHLWVVISHWLKTVQTRDKFHLDMFKWSFLGPYGGIGNKKIGVKFLNEAKNTPPNEAKILKNGGILIVQCSFWHVLMIQKNSSLWTTVQHSLFEYLKLKSFVKSYQIDFRTRMIFIWIQWSYLYKNVFFG